jgi:CheY-like chemotaxis protein
MATILVVDDEPMVLGMCATILKAGQHEVLEATEPGRALEVKQSPDLALLDVMMPGMNGIELARHLQERHPKIKIVLMTGFGIRDVAAMDRDIPYRIIWKPFKAESLLQMIDNVLEESAL